MFQTRQPKGVLNAYLAFFLLAYCITFLVVYLGRKKLTKINSLFVNPIYPKFYS